jgi:hypothetical protein
MKPELYTCEDDELLRDTSAVAEAGAPPLFAHLLVYRSASGRTGFGTDELGRGLTAWLLEGGWFWNGGERVATRLPAGELLLAALRRQVKPEAVTVRGPDAETLAAFAEAERAAAERKRVALLARYGRAAEAPAPAALEQLEATDPGVRGRALALLARHSDCVLLWGISEFGLYARALTANSAFLAAVRDCCAERGVEFHVAPARRDLPVW